MPGGGTVTYVNEVEHRYMRDLVHREEGGTPAIIESIRAGLVFQLKRRRRRAGDPRAGGELHSPRVASWRENPSIEILGNPDAERLSIVSFVIRVPMGAAQTPGRATCTTTSSSRCSTISSASRRAAAAACAGPYGHRLLGIDLDTSREFEREIVRGCEGIKPGWVRVNFNYFISEPVFDFIVKALHLVADEGARLLPDYRFDALTGQWRHRQRSPRAAACASADLSYRSGKLEFRARMLTEPEWALEGYVEAARRAMDGAPSRFRGAARSDPPPPSADFEELRWFPLPGEVATELFHLEDGRDAAQASAAL